MLAATSARLRATRAPLGAPRRVALRPATLVDAARFARYRAGLAAAARGREAPPFGLSVCFLPRRPAAFYFAPSVLSALRARIVTDASRADVVWAFEDQTLSDVPAPTNRPVVNGRCRDVRKSTVAAAFAAVGGARILVDPTRADGLIVEKSEENGTHDGRIVEAPCRRREGRCYQRLIDNRVPGGLVEDLRTVVVGGVPTLVFRKRRREGRRFANENAEVAVCDPGDVLSLTERRLLSDLCARIGLDCGGLDVLRCAETGEIAVVDANKTDMGPPLALPLRQQIDATYRLAAATAAYLKTLAEGEAA